MQQLLPGIAGPGWPKHGEFSARSWRPKAGRAARAYLLAVFALAFDVHSSVAASQMEQLAADRERGAPTAGAQSPPPVLSKFEARRIRHRCQDQAGASTGRELRHCFELHVAARRFWSECKRKSQVVNLRGREKEEAIRRCVIEKLGDGRRSQP